MFRLLTPFLATRCWGWFRGGSGKASSSFVLESGSTGRWGGGGKASPWWALYSWLQFLIQSPILLCHWLTTYIQIGIYQHDSFDHCISCLYTCTVFTYSKITSTSPPPSSHTTASHNTSLALTIAFFFRHLFSPFSPLLLLPALPSPRHLPLLLHLGRLALPLILPLLHLSAPLHLQSFSRPDRRLHPAWSS